MLYSDISPRTSAYADKQLLIRAEINNIAGRFGDSKELPKKSSKTITFRRYAKLSSTPVSVQEGVTPTGKTLSATDYTCTLVQYGDFVRITDVIIDTHEDAVLNESIDILSEQASEMIDKVRIGVMKAGTNVQYANGSARTDVNSIVTKDLLLTCKRILKGQHAKPLTKIVQGGAKINTYPIAASFIALCHTDLEPDLRRVSGFIPIEDYSSNMGSFPEEIGAIGGVRFVGDNNLSAWADGGGTYDTNYTTISTSSAQSDVYPILIIGQHAYGVVALSGKSGVTTLISNPKAIAGDELAQKGSAGWKAWSGAVILNQSWMIRLEVAAKG